MKNKTNIIIFLVCLFLALMSLLWFKHNLYIAGGDSFLPLYPWEQLKSFFSAWTDRFQTGVPTLTQINYVFPFLAFWAFLQKLGFSLLTTEKLWFIFLIFCSGSSFYFLLQSFFPKLDTKAKILAVVYYMVNPIVFFLFTPPMNNQLLTLIFIPLSLGLVHRLFSTKNSKYVYLIALSSTLIIGMGANIPLLVASFLPLIIYLVYQAITNRKFLSDFFRLVIPAFILSLVVNSFWIVQFLISFKRENVQAVSDNSWLTWTSTNANIINLLRSLGHWSWSERVFDSFYISYHQLYQTNIYYIIACLILLVIICSLFRLIKNKKFYLFFFIPLFLIGLFLAKGPNKPFGELFKWLYENTAIFSLFREPWTKFSPVILLSGAMLFGLGADFLIEKMQDLSHYKKWLRYSPIVLFSFLLILLIVYSKPFFNGQIIPFDRGKYPGTAVDVPSYWFETTQYINQNSDIKRILLLPPNPFYQIHLFWSLDGYYGVDPSIDSILKPTFSVNPEGGYLTSGESNAIIKNIYQKITNQETDFDFNRVLSILGIRHILLRNDLDWKQIGWSEWAKSTQEVSKYLVDNFGAKKIASFGKINLETNQKDEYFQQNILPENQWLKDVPANEIYEIPSVKNYSLVTTEQSTTLIDSSIEDFIDAAFLPFTINNNIIFTTQNSAEINNQLNRVSNQSVLLINEGDLQFENNAYSSKFLLQQSKEYEIYLKPKKDIDSKKAINISINGTTYSWQKKDQIGKEWFKIGSQNFEKNSENELKISSINVQNQFNDLVKNGNFSQNSESWKLADCSEGWPGNPDYSMSVDKENDFNFLRLQSSNHIACTKQQINGLKENNYYLLKFKFRNLAGTNPRLLLEHLDNNLSYEVEKLPTLSAEINWQEKQFLFKAEKNDLNIYLYADSNGQKTINDYKDVELLEIPQLPFSEIAFAETNQTEKLNLSDKPEAKIIKYNPFYLSYKIEIKGGKSPYLINFMQSYNEGWKARIVGVKKDLTLTHHLANGYANGWIIDEDGDCTVEIYYWPQKIFLMTIMVSGLAVLLSIIGFWLARRKKIYYD